MLSESPPIQAVLKGHGRLWGASRPEVLETASMQTLAYGRRLLSNSTEAAFLAGSSAAYHQYQGGQTTRGRPRRHSGSSCAPGREVVGWTWTSRDLKRFRDLDPGGIGAGSPAHCRGGPTSLLDEFTYPMACGWISVEDVAEVLQARPGFQQFGIDDVNVDGPVALSAALPTKNLICISSSAATLRRSPVAVTDLVTEMRKVKHPFDAGIPAQRAIE